MNVLLTAAVLLALGLWAIGSYGRLVRLRAQVKARWREVHALRKHRQDLAAAEGTAPAGAGASASEDATRALAHAERLYNLVAAKYNGAIESVPGNLFAGLAGFKRADPIDIAKP